MNKAALSAQVSARSKGNQILFYLFTKDTPNGFDLMSQPEVDHFRPDFARLMGTYQDGAYLPKEETTT